MSKKPPDMSEVTEFNKKLLFCYLKVIGIYIKIKLASSVHNRHDILSAKVKECSNEDVLKEIIIIPFIYVLFVTISQCTKFIGKLSMSTEGSEHANQKSYTSMEKVSSLSFNKV